MTVIKSALCWMMGELNKTERSGIYGEVTLRVKLQMRKKQPGSGLGEQLSKQV